MYSNSFHYFNLLDLSNIILSSLGFETDSIRLRPLEINMNRPFFYMIKKHTFVIFFGSFQGR